MGIVFRSGALPWRCSIAASASCNTVSVVRPRKSILSMPACSRQFMSYWLTITCSSSTDPAPLVDWVQMGT